MDYRAFLTYKVICAKRIIDHISLLSLFFLLSLS